MVLVFLLIACGNKKNEPTNVAFVMSDTMLKKCQYTKAAYMDIQSDLKLFGKVKPDNNRSANIYSVLGGSVEKINVEIGDYVKEGQILATIRSSEVATIQQEKLNALADISVAKKNLQRTKDLYEGKLNSEKDMIAAQRDLDVAEAELARINELYSIFSLAGGSTYHIKAPISGYIIRKDISPNEILNKDAEDILFSLAEIKDVWVVANVNESDISNVALGYDADVTTIAYPDRIYKGKVDKILNAIDPVTKAMQIIIKIENSDMTLKPEMSTIVHVHYTEDRKLIAVPSSSIIFDENRNWVVVFRSRNDVEVRKVELEKDINGTAFIKSGLKDGETVISKNGLFIYDALTD